MTLARLEDLVVRARARRGLDLLVVNLRILLAFALMPSGLKKVVGEPFTDPTNTGPFHEFLHAFFATGAFYPFVGAMQLTAALLLMSQRFATIGALVLLPIITTILVFCWSTRVYFTATVATLMFLGTVFLVLWDLPKWRGVFARDDAPLPAPAVMPTPTVDLALWRNCGLGIYILYMLLCAVTGEIYRPRGVELDNPAFWLFPVLVTFPVVTWLVDRHRFRRRRAMNRAGARDSTAP